MFNTQVRLEVKVVRIVSMTIVTIDTMKPAQTILSLNVNTNLSFDIVLYTILNDK